MFYKYQLIESIVFKAIYKEMKRLKIAEISPLKDSLLFKDSPRNFLWGTFVISLTSPNVNFFNCSASQFQIKAREKPLNLLNTETLVGGEEMIKWVTKVTDYV